jgi:deferrochelatase/peroxidase EfeB
MAEHWTLADPRSPAGPGPGDAGPDSTGPDGTGPGGPSRRRLLTGAGLFGAGAVAGGLTGYFTRSATEPSGTADASLGQQTIPFYGAHQAGIITPAQDRLAFGTMNVVPGTSRADLRDLLRVWTGAAARMTAGQLVGEETEPDAPPVDTGEAVGSPVSRLTITIGYGPALFDDRFGLAARKPAALADLPPLPNENLDPDYTGGDLCVQACADNPLVAFHAVRNLARIGMGVVAHNWMELGFGRTSTTSTAQATPRNLLGFKDGTRILRRGYSFTDGIDPQVGTLLGGLFFIAFMQSPNQFIQLQQSLASDALNEYIHHTGSAVFAVPPGLRPGQHYGDTLFT